MGVIELYILFALTTGFVASYELVTPVLFELSLEDPGHNMIEHKWLSQFVFFLMNVVGAPLILPACIVPSFGERFRGALVKALAKP